MNETENNGKKAGKTLWFIGIGIVLILLLIAGFIQQTLTEYQAAAGQITEKL